MRHFAAGFALISALGSLVLGPDRASAEGFFDMYIGGSFTSNNPTVVSGSIFGLPTPTAAATSFDDSVQVGLRGGGYFPSLPFIDIGLALDISFFNPNTKTAAGAKVLDFYVLPVTPLVFIRVPLLKTERIEKGVLQPYVAVGPGLFTTAAINDGALGGSFASVSFDVGVDVRAGVVVKIARRFGMFVEYRYTDFNASWSDFIASTAGGGSRIASSTFKTNHIALGMRF